jgi:hypothetical protein
MADNSLMEEDQTDQVDQTDGMGGDAGSAGADSGFSFGGGVPVPPPAAPAPATQDNWWIPKPAPTAINGLPIEEDNARQRNLFSQILHSAPSVEEAEKGILLAQRLEGILGFNADQNAGVPVMDALKKWGPKIYAKQPAAYANLLRQQQAMEKPPFMPSETTVGNQKLIQMSPNRYAFPPNSAAKFQPEIVELGGQKLIRTGPNHLSRIPEPKDHALANEEWLTKRDIASLQKQMESGNTLPSEVPNFQAKIDEAKDRLRSLSKSKSDTKESHRSEGLALIKKYPAKADAIRERFKKQHNEDL